MGFTETKTDDTDLINIEGYTLFLKNRHKLTRTRSGGIGLLVKNHIKQHISLVNTDCKYALWFKISKTLCHTDEDILCSVIYIPPENTRYVNSDCFEDLEQSLIQIGSSCKYVCLLGDFNARIGKLLDYFQQETETEHYHTTLNSVESVDDAFGWHTDRDVPLDRFSKDSKTNNFGYKFAEFCKCNMLFVLNGRFGQDKLRYWTLNVSRQQCSRLCCS